MKLQNLLVTLPLAAATLNTMANTPADTLQNRASFHFSTQVERTVEKDLMQVEVYSRKTGKKLSDLKKSVSDALNSVLKSAKQYPNIDISTNGLSNYADYDNKGKVVGWVAEGSVQLTGKEFESIANIVENLGDEVAIRYVDFSVSPETLASLEDEMTLEIIKQFQHKAALIQKSLNAKSYQLSEVHLNTPNGRSRPVQTKMYLTAETAFRSASASEPLPLEAGKATISASASGKVVFE
ncbi:MAG: SIMPL domain-containing protein [Pasteurellaceae bacterium]|nr:SIMPL domain-containing protein [Pasteurellaceae bacterium]